MVELRPSDQVTERLDVVMVHRGLAESRARAQGLIMAGAVRVASQAVRELRAGSLTQVPASRDRGAETQEDGFIHDRLDVVATDRGHE